MLTPDRQTAAAASLEAGLEAWHGFHREVLARMSDLALALDRQDQPEVERACRWVHERLDAHHGWEEQELLSRLEPAGAADLAAVLRADHRDMIRLAGQALDPGTPDHTHHPSAPARRLLDLVRHHVDTEQNRVMPLLRGRQEPGPMPGAGYHTPPRWRG